MNICERYSQGSRDMGQLGKFLKVIQQTNILRDRIECQKNLESLGTYADNAHKRYRKDNPTEQKKYLAFQQTLIYM